MAIHFALTDQSTKDYGTGIAEFSHQGGKWSFRKYYYEPELQGRQLRHRALREALSSRPQRSCAELLPSSRRATISSWICCVPSKMSRIFESRDHFSSRPPSV